MQFYEYFVQAANEIGWSQNYISKEFDINRGLLYNFYKGEAALPLNKFREILDKMVLPTPTIKNLCDQYYKEYYGRDEFARIKYIEKMLAKLDGAAEASCVGRNTEFEPISENGVAYLSSKTDIVNAAEYMLNANKKGKIITNYPYSYESLDDVLFEYITENDDFSLLHMLVFDKENTGTKNLENIFCSVRWLAYQINPVCQFDYINLSEAAPYPCYIALGEYCLFFNPYQDKGILLKSAEVFAQVKDVSEKFAESGFPLAFIPRDMLDLKNGIGHADSDKVEFCLSGYPCLSPIADEELIYSIVKKSIPNIDFLAQIAVEHYNDGLNIDDEKFVLSASGLREFAETGKVAEIPEMFVNEAPPTERIRYFNRLEKMIDKGGAYILDDAQFRLPKTILMDFYTNVVQILGEFFNVPDDLNFHGNYIINISDKTVRRTLHNFIEYMQSNKCFYSANLAKSFLNSLIVYCEKLK